MSHAGKEIYADNYPKQEKVPAPMPDEYSIHSPVTTSRVVPKRFKELLMLHNLRRARRDTASNLESPVNCDNAPISRIREPEDRSNYLVL